MRTALDFFVDPAQVLAQDSQTDQLDRTQEKNADQCRCPAGDGHVGYELLVQDDRCGDHRERLRHKAQRRGDSQRHPGKREDGVRGHLDQPDERLAGDLVAPAVALHRHAHLAEPDPGAQARNVAVSFGQGDEQVDDASIHQAEQAGLLGDGNLGQAAEHGVKAAEECAFDERLLPVGSDGVHDVGAALPLRDEILHRFGPILEVRVHDDHRVAGGMPEAGVHRRHLAEIARQVHHPDIVVLRNQAGQVGEAAVRAAVVDEDEFRRAGQVSRQRQQPLE